jgi:hypothetical protein
LLKTQQSGVLLRYPTYGHCYHLRTNDGNAEVPEKKRLLLFMSMKEHLIIMEKTMKKLIIPLTFTILFSLFCKNEKKCDHDKEPCQIDILVLLWLFTTPVQVRFQNNAGSTRSYTFYTDSVCTQGGIAYPGNPVANGTMGAYGNGPLRGSYYIGNGTACLTTPYSFDFVMPALGKVTFTDSGTGITRAIP